MKTKSKQKQACPISKVVGLFGDSCSILIVRDLLDEPRRFSELEESLGASTRTLTLKLKKMEQEGLVRRKVFAKGPPHVEYALTKKGAAFHKVTDAMRLYGKKYL